jgi:hypothetical protein
MAWFGLVNAGGVILSIGMAEMMRRRVALGDPRMLLRMLLVLTGLITVGMLAFGAARSFLVAVTA